MKAIDPFYVLIFAVFAGVTQVSCAMPAVEQDFEPVYDAYLFAYFAGNGPDREQVHYAISDDGFNYKALNGNKPVLDSKTISTSGGVRDPHLLRSPDGKTFYMVLTDLYVPEMGWNNTKMVMLRSDDLINWQHAIVDIPKQFSERFDDVNRVWAPQTIYDEMAGKYMLYFSMKKGEGPDIIYYAYANDGFTGLETEPKQLYYPPNKEDACIDGDIVKKDGKYYLFHKAESGEPGIKLAISDRLTGGYELVSDQRVDRERAQVEGSGTFKLNDRDAWVLMYDVYTSGRYQFTISEDLRRFEVVDDQVSMNFHPRHGSVLPITAEEKQLLVEKWGFEEDAANAGGWSTNTWAGSGELDYEEQGESLIFAIESTDGGDLSWGKPFSVEPNQLYELSGMIRTEGLEAGTGRGALLNIHGLSGVMTDAVTGSRDWTDVQTVFNSGDRTLVSVNCLFGGWGQSTGKAFYKDVMLRHVGDPAELQPITIDGEALRPEMSELIYSQFIEHMGRCIYGGIWAEMLEDRKFYHPITGDYNPYGNDAKFPPIVRSPWERVGSVAMVKDEPFVGDHDPQITAGSAIRQHDLGVVKGKTYTGYIWLRASGGDPSVRITLDPAGDPVEIKPAGGEYQRFAYEFTASETTDKATLTVSVRDGDVRVGTLSLMPADNVEGMRADTLKLLKQLNSPLYRWPGGNFVSGYDWRDGIGDRDRRPPRTNPAWTGVEHNDFGMHEFIRLCELLHSEPLITINMGFEGAFSAEAEFEYANGSSDTHWGARRVANGSEKPFNVKYWCIGNEMWGDWQLGFMSAEDYQTKHNWVMDRLRKNHPDFVAIGSGDAGPWSRGLLENSADRMDLIAEHFYIFDPSENVAEHVNKVPLAIRRKADYHRQTQHELGLLEDRPVPIAMTEWNYWYGPHPYGELGTVYYLKDALGIAAGIHEYARCSDIIGAAFYAQTVNVIGCIKTTKTDAFLATTALPLIMYREHFGTIPVELDTGYAAQLGLDIAAAWTEDRKTLTIAVVNANPTAKTIDLNFENVRPQGTADKWWFAGENPHLLNSADETNLVIQHADGVDLGKPVEVPGYSSTIYRIPVISE